MIIEEKVHLSNKSMFIVTVKGTLLLFRGYVSSKSIKTFAFLKKLKLFIKKLTRNFIDPNKE